MRRKTLEAVIALIESHTSTPTSPTQPTKQTHSSDDLLTMMKMMSEMFRESQTQMRDMVLDILQGRATQPTSMQVIAPTPNEMPMNFDDDSIPLPPGIEAVMAREAEETQQQALLRERAALQERLAELTRERNLLYESEDSSPAFSDNGTYPETSESNTQP